MENIGVRQALSKKIRFEVLKRDLFKCKYCGKTAEETKLHIDHIHPVALGGANDIMNLVTACEACNLGKKAIPLSDTSASMQARRQTELLHEQKEVLEMMAEWRSGLVDLQQDKVAKIAAYWNAYTTGYSLSENYYPELRKITQKYSFDEVCDAIDDATSQYLKFDIQGNVTPESFDLALEKLKPILSWKKKFKDDPELEKLMHIQSIAKKRLAYFNATRAMAAMKAAIAAGASIDAFKDVALKSKNWTHFMETVENLEVEAAARSYRNSEPEIESVLSGYSLEHWKRVSKEVIESSDIQKLKAHKMWACDVCGQPIIDTSDGSILRHYENNSYYFKLGHSNDPECKSHLILENMGEISTFSEKSLIYSFPALFQCSDNDRESLSEVFKRINQPLYEWTRFHITDAIKADVVFSYLTSEDCLFDWQLERVAAWLGGKGAYSEAPHGSFESSSNLTLN